MSTERERRELGERGELGVLSSHHCSVTLIVTVKLLGCNKFVRHLVQANWFNWVSTREIHQLSILQSAILRCSVLVCYNSCILLSNPYMCFSWVLRNLELDQPKVSDTSYVSETLFCLVITPTLMGNYEFLWNFKSCQSGCTHVCILVNIVHASIANFGSKR